MESIPDMKHKDALSRVYAHGTIDDGYNGSTLRVGYAFDPVSGRTLTVTDSGYNWSGSGLPPAVDEAESKWLLLNHPDSRAKNIVMVQA